MKQSVFSSDAKRRFPPANRERAERDRATSVLRAKLLLISLAASFSVAGCVQEAPAPAPPAATPKAVAKRLGPAPFPVTPAPLTPPFEPGPPAPPARKLAVFTPSGLLTLDLTITIDGAPLNDAVAALARRLIAAADADGDGRTGWDELAGNRRFLSGPLAGGAIRTPRNDRRQWRDLYDADGDGRVDPDEALAWLERDARGGQLGLSLLGGRSYTPSLVASATWRTLDADASGGLSSEEIVTAPETLLSRDVNDDHVLAPSEFLSLADLARLRLEGNPLAGGMAYSSYNDAAFRSALLLDHNSDARDAQSTLASFGGSPNDPRVFGFAEQLAAAIDADGNGYLAKTEWPALRTAESHARLDIDYQVGVAGSPTPESRLETALPEDRLSVGPDPRDASRFWIRVAPRAEEDPGGVLLVAVIDEIDSRSPEVRVTGLFGRLDADGDDRLSIEELEASGSELAGFDEEALRLYDSDGDDSSSYEEFVAYYADLTARDRLSVSVVVNDATDPHFATLDLNGDGRLGEREIDRADETLRAATHHGALRPDSAPWRMRLTVYRTRRQLDAMERGPTTAYQRDTPDAPVWFLGADANRDGEVSRREFLGDDTIFAEYDTDRDGYLTLPEIGER